VHLHKLDIDAARKGWADLYLGPHAKHQVVGNLANIGDAVGVAHGYASDAQVKGCEQNVLGGIARQGGRDPHALPNRLAHIDADLLDPVVDHFQVQIENAAAGLDLERRLFGDAVVIDILRHATDAVAAHLRFTAVCIEHAHAGVGLLGRTDQD